MELKTAGLKRLKNKVLDHLYYFNVYKSANDQAVIN